MMLLIFADGLASSSVMEWMCRLRVERYSRDVAIPMPAPTGGRPQNRGLFATMQGVFGTAFSIPPKHVLLYIYPLCNVSAYVLLRFAA